MNNVHLLRSNGTRVEHPNPQHPGKYFSLGEDKFQQNLKQYGEITFCGLLMGVMDGFREKIGEPFHVTGFNRDKKKQIELNKNPAYKAATVSPHVEFLAADGVPDSIAVLHHIWRQSEFKNQAVRRSIITLMKNHYVPTLERVAFELKIKIRIGVDEYLDNNQSFIHIDVCPEFYAKGQVWYNEPHPSAWSYQARW